MKIKIISSLIFFFIFSVMALCGQNLKKLNNSISPNLLEEIKKFELYTDSLETYENYLKKAVIFIDIISNGSDCELIIGKHMVYYGNEMTGYLNYGEKLLVFYSIPDSCNCELIKVRKLKRGRPNNMFPDENSFEALSTEFDPWGRRFKITENNELILIKQGML